MTNSDLVRLFFTNSIIVILVYMYYGKVKEKKMYVAVIVGSFIGMILV